MYHTIACHIMCLDHWEFAVAIAVTHTGLTLSQFFFCAAALLRTTLTCLVDLRGSKGCTSVPNNGGIHGTEPWTTDLIPYHTIPYHVGNVANFCYAGDQS